MMNNKLFPYNKKIDEEKHLLFCVHHAGGTGAIFRKWIELMEDSSIQIVPLELPGHGYRRQENLITEYNQLVEDLFNELYPFVKGKTYSIFGHSMGAALAFSIEYLLEKSGINIAQKIIVAGRFAPNVADPGDFRVSMGDEALLDDLRALNSENSVIYDNREFIDFFLPVIRNDYAVHEQFKYNNEVIQAPITAHCGTEDYDSSFKYMQHWKDVTSGCFKIKEFVGNHFFLHALGQSYLHEIEEEL